jgi:hypothetical protein
MTTCAACSVEPVFGHTKHNRKIDRFQRRGRAAAPSEWRLVAATHNLAKAPQPPNRPCDQLIGDSLGLPVPTRHQDPPAARTVKNFSRQPRAKAGVAG